MMECPVQCGCNAHATPGFFSMAGTAVKASDTGARHPVDVCFARNGVETSPTGRAFVLRKPCLQKSERRFERTIFCLLES